MNDQTLWGGDDESTEVPEAYGLFPGWRANRWPWTIRISRPAAKRLDVWDKVWIEVSPREDDDA